MPNAYLDMNGQLVTGGMNPMPSMPGAYPDASGNIVGNGLGPWNPAGGDPCSAQVHNIHYLYYLKTKAIMSFVCTTIANPT